MCLFSVQVLKLAICARTFFDHADMLWPLQTITKMDLSAADGSSYEIFMSYFHSLPRFWGFVYKVFHKCSLIFTSLLIRVCLCVVSHGKLTCFYTESFHWQNEMEILNGCETLTPSDFYRSTLERTQLVSQCSTSTLSLCDFMAN